MGAPLLQYYKVRVLDPVSGSVLIDPLPHPGQITFETMFSQPGLPGSVSIGSCNIPLFPPLSDEYKWAKVDYDNLKQMARVEIYPCATAAQRMAQGAWGDPVFTGVITSLPKTLSSYQIEASDSLFLAQVMRTGRNEIFNGTTDVLFKNSLKAYGSTFVDGDPSIWTLANYTNDGTWATSTVDTFASVTAGTTGDGLLYTNATYTNGKYAEMLVISPFVITCQAVAGKTADGGCIAGVADANNFVLGRALVRFTNASLYAVDAQIYVKSVGVYSLRAQVQTVLQFPTNVCRVQVALYGLQIDSTHYFWAVLLNGIDVGCSWTQVAGVGAPTGAVGIRADRFSVAQTGAACSANQLAFLSKGNIFQNGAITVGSQTINQRTPIEAPLDLLNLAITAEGFTFRKNPKAGLNNDTMDFALNPGTDRSADIAFRERENIVDGGPERNAEPLNTAVIASGNPGLQGAGLQYWFNPNAIAKYGLVLDTVSAPNGTDLLTVRRGASQILINRAAPDQAKRITVMCDSDHAADSGVYTPTGLRYREGDQVTLHMPTLGIYNQRVTIMSTKLTEGSPMMEMTLDQLPVYADVVPGWERMKQNMRHLYLRNDEVAGATNIVGSAGVAGRASIQLPIMPYKMRVYQAAAQNYNDNATSVVNFDTVDFDAVNSFDGVAHQFTAPVTGYYFLSAAVAVDMPAVANVFQELLPEIWVNGAVSRYGNTIMYEQGGVAVGRLMQATVSDCFGLNQGDTVQIEAFVLKNAAGTIPAHTGYSATYWSMHLVSV